MNIYKEHSYENREAYLKSLSEKHGVAFETVLFWAEISGTDKDFNGLEAGIKYWAEKYGKS